MEIETLRRALERIRDAEIRSDRRHKHMVGVEVVQDLQRIARVALERASLGLPPEAP